MSRCILSRIHATFAKVSSSIYPFCFLCVVLTLCYAFAGNPSEHSILHTTQCLLQLHCHIVFANYLIKCCYQLVSLLNAVNRLAIHTSTNCPRHPHAIKCRSNAARKTETYHVLRSECVWGSDGTCIARHLRPAATNNHTESDSYSLQLLVSSISNVAYTYTACMQFIPHEMHRKQ